MIKRPIRNFHSAKSVPPRFCDVIIENDKIYLEKKTEKNKYEKISWEDVVFQVEAAKADNK